MGFARNDARASMRKQDSRVQDSRVQQLYNDVERPLSQALQPECTLETVRIIVGNARNKLREIMRSMGWQGPF